MIRIEQLLRGQAAVFAGFNPTKLMFSVSKAWVRHRFLEIWLYHEGAFNDLLRSAVGEIQCDTCAMAHSRPSGLYELGEDVQATPQRSTAQTRLEEAVADDVLKGRRNTDESHC